MIVGGALVAGIVGIPLTIVGVIGFKQLLEMAGDNSSALDNDKEAGRRVFRMMAIVPGMVGVIGGSVLLTLGTIRERRYRRWKAAQLSFAVGKGLRLSPYVSAYGRKAQMVGFAGRF